MTIAMYAERWEADVAEALEHEEDCREALRGAKQQLKAANDAHRKLVFGNTEGSSLQQAGLSKEAKVEHDGRVKVANLEVARCKGLVLNLEEAVEEAAEDVRKMADRLAGYRSRALWVEADGGGQLLVKTGQGSQDDKVNKLVDSDGGEKMSEKTIKDDKVNKLADFEKVQAVPGGLPMFGSGEVAEAHEFLVRLELALTAAQFPSSRWGAVLAARVKSVELAMLVAQWAADCSWEEVKSKFKLHVHSPSEQLQMRQALRTIKRHEGETVLQLCDRFALQRSKLTDPVDEGEARGFSV